MPDSAPACARRGRLDYEENVQDAIQALDVALKHSVSLRDDTQVTRALPF